MGDMWQDMLQGEPNIWLSYEMVFFDEIPTTEEVIKLIRDAFKSGFVKQESIDSWENEGVENEANRIINKKTPYIRLSLTDRWLYYGSYYEEVIKLYPELRVIKYSEAKDYLVNESEEINDFTWVTDEPINPWLQYSMIIFDEEPTREEINNYIELALNTGRISNKEAWEIGREQDIDGILEYIRQDGGAVLKIDQWGDLQYADISYYNSSHNAIRYSQLANKNLNESEDDWDWARGPVFTNEFNIGDRIRVYNTGSESAFIEWLGMYGQPYLNGEYGKHIEGVVTDVGYDGFLTLAVDSSQINFPTDGHREDISSVDRSLKGLSISYEQII